jgi:hypothetical protein
MQYKYNPIITLNALDFTMNGIGNDITEAKNETKHASPNA